MEEVQQSQESTKIVQHSDLSYTNQSETNEQQSAQVQYDPFYPFEGGPIRTPVTNPQPYSAYDAFLRGGRGRGRGRGRGNRGFNRGGRGGFRNNAMDMQEELFNPGMLEDPWAHLS